MPDKNEEEREADASGTPVAEFTKVESITSSEDRQDIVENGIEPNKPKDYLGGIIGEFGRWQLINIPIVFLAGVPGIAHIFSPVFVAAKTDFWCVDDLPEDVNFTQANISLNADSCRDDCKEYNFDHSFWKSTIITEWELICGYSYLTGKLPVQPIDVKQTTLSIIFQWSPK